MTPGSAPQQFSAVLPGAINQDVTWSMEPAVGALSPQGLYAPLSDVPSPQAVTITARSPSDPSIQGRALVAVFNNSPALVGVTPPQVSSPLTPGQTQQFKASFAGGQTTFSWSLLPNVGSFDPQTEGLYIAPDTISAPQFVLVIATSALGAVIYGTALVMLSPGD